MYAFLSYQTDDREVAGRVSVALQSIGVRTFLAHEQIEVSEEWRVALLNELRQTDLFVPLLSANYYQSIWCVQESGIAAFSGMTIIPLSIDGTIPRGFLGHIQSTRIDPANPDRNALFPGLARHDVEALIDGLIEIVARSRDFRGAEANLDLVRPYLDRATRPQIVRLLSVSTENNQVCNAGGCIRALRALLKSHGRYMKRVTRKELTETLARYP